MTTTTGFKEGNYYVYKTKTGKAIGPYDKRSEAEADIEYGDSLLMCLSYDFKPTLKEAHINFDDKTLTIKGVFKDFQDGTYKIPDDMMSTIITEVTKCCNKVTVTGVPPIEGECLDALLYM